jgi:TRAP-type C4-dicarboxylate transport system permease small subunit
MERRVQREGVTVRSRLYQWLMALAEVWAMLLLIAMLLVVVLGVFYRYVLDASLIWYDEFASYLLVWLTFYGAVVAAHHRKHIAFDTMVERLGAPARRWVAASAEVCVLIFQGILCYYGWVLMVAVRVETAVSLEWVRMDWVYSVFPITGGLMLLISLVDLARVLQGEIPGKEEAGGATAE